MTTTAKSSGSVGSQPGTPYVGPQEFFQATVDFRAQHTALYDFIHPMTAAVWNLRWQVDGYSRARPDVTEEELWSRFLRGSGSSARWKSLKRAFFGTPWPTQQQEIAKYALLSMTSLFEGWLDELVGVLLPPKTDRRTLINQLQFPSNDAPKPGVGNARGRPRPSSGAGATGAMAKLVGGGSLLMAGFRARLRAPRRARPIGEKYSLAELQGLLIMFRYFKEVRNSISHQNATATEELVLASQRALTLDVSKLRLPQAPKVPSYSLRDPVAISIADVIGYSEILLRIVLTLDAELAASPKAEWELRRRWVRRWGEQPQRLPANSAAHDDKVAFYLRWAEVPVPTNLPEVRRWLLDSRLLMEPSRAKVREYQKRALARNAWLASNGP